MFVHCVSENNLKVNFQNIEIKVVKVVNMSKKAKWMLSAAIANHTDFIRKLYNTNPAIIQYFTSKSRNI